VRLRACELYQSLIRAGLSIRRRKRLIYRTNGRQRANEEMTALHPSWYIRHEVARGPTCLTPLEKTMVEPVVAACWAATRPRTACSSRRKARSICSHAQWPSP
jgi:hypothetical protein